MTEKAETKEEGQASWWKWLEEKIGWLGGLEDIKLEKDSR